MLNTAQVHSIDTVADFRVALAVFLQDARESLAALDLETRKAVDWLSGQLDYWKSEVRRRQTAVEQAKADLDRKRISAVFGRPPDLTDQIIALRKAKLQLEEAEEKIEAVKSWRRIVEREIEDFAGPKQQLEGLLDAQLVSGMALLARIVERLEAYVAAAPPTEGTSSSMAAPTPATESTTAAAVVARSPDRATGLSAIQRGRPSVPPVAGSGDPATTGSEPA